MRSVLRVAALLCGTCLAVSTPAEMVTVAVTGVDDLGSPYTLATTFDPGTVSPYYPYGFPYENVVVSVDGSRETGYFFVTPAGSTEFVEFYGDDFNFNFVVNPSGGVLPFSLNKLPVPTPTVTDGSYSGYVLCASLTMPQQVRGAMSTLALLQLPSLTLGCFEEATLTVSRVPPSPPPSSVTPEPSTIGLLGTGALGLIGLVRRRWH